MFCQCGNTLRTITEKDIESSKYVFGCIKKYFRPLSNREVLNLLTDFRMKNEKTGKLQSKLANFTPFSDSAIWNRSLLQIDL